jgi:hypothetical protein
MLGPVLPLADCRRELVRLSQAMRETQRKLALQAEASHVRMVRDWQAAAPNKRAGASVTPGRA